MAYVRPHQKRRGSKRMNQRRTLNLRLLLCMLHKITREKTTFTRLADEFNMNVETLRLTSLAARRDLGVHIAYDPVRMLLYVETWGCLHPERAANLAAAHFEAHSYLDHHVA